MQKKLIALAIAGLASTAAFAQSNVTIYGVVDASVDFTNVGDSATTSGQRENKISSNASRIGFKGSEDLGDGLKAVFQIETAFNVDGTSATNLNSRNTYVGLASDRWGQILLGQYDSPYKTSTRALDVFGDHLADNRNLMGGVKGKSAALAFDGRPADTVRFDSPDLKGFKFAAAYVAGAEANSNSSQTRGKAWSLSANYAITSAVNGIVAYERHDYGSASVTGSSFSAIAPAAAGQTEKAWKVGIAYKADAIRAGLVYEKTRDDFATSKEHKAWTISGGYLVNAGNEIKLAYTKAGDMNNAANTGASQWAVGVDHLLSKRTKLYAEYVKLSNEKSASYMGAALVQQAGAHWRRRACQCRIGLWVMG